jgi:hypothetical protein
VIKVLIFSNKFKLHGAAGHSNLAALSLNGDIFKCHHDGMQFNTHPEIHEFKLDTLYRGAMFAWPVLINGSLVSTRGWSLDQLGILEMGSYLNTNRFLCHEAQGVTFLASAVDASFVSSARSNEVDVMRMLVSLQNSFPLTNLSSEIFRISPFDVAGGGLVFIVGSVYRKAKDLRQLFLPDPDEFLVSKERLAMEVALSNGDLHYRHQILPAFPISKAVAEGLRSGVQCWSGMFAEPMRCEFDLESTGDVTFALRIEETRAVYLRFGQDVMCTEDMSRIQEVFVRCSASSAIGQSHFKH